MLRQLLKSIQLERIKYRHTKLWLIVFIVAIFLPLVFFISSFFTDVDAFGYSNKVTTNWLETVFNFVEGFTLVFLTAAIVLLSGSINGIEHKNNTWQLIETQPQPKWSIYLAKWLSVLFWMLLVIVCYFLFQYLFVTLRFYTNNIPKDTFYISIPWSKTILYILNLFLASWSFASVMFVLHINIYRTNVVTTFGLIVVVGFLFVNSFNLNLPTWIPIVQLDKISISEVGEWISYYARFSAVQAVFILLLGYLFYDYKNYKRYFLKYKKVVLTAVVILIGLVGVSYWLDQPRYQPSYGKSIIAGTIKKNQAVDLVVLNSDDMVLTKVPIRADGSFHIDLSGLDIPKNQYYIADLLSKQKFSNYNKTANNFYMTNGDSIYLALKIEDDNTSVKVSGDRRAESAFIGYYTFPNMYDMNWKIEEKNYNNKEDFFKSLTKNYKQDIAKVKNNKTVDGFVIGKDIMKNMETIAASYALNLFQKYTKVNLNDTLYFSTKNPFIQQLKSQLQFNDAALAFDVDFAKSYFRTLNNDQEVKDIDKIDLVSKIKDANMQDAMRYIALVSIIDNNTIEDTTAISVVEIAAADLKSKMYSEDINSKLKSRKAKTDFSVLPEFVFKDLDGKKRSLKEYLGKYIVIDVWASWCAPCRDNAPYFYDYADKMSSANVQFVAISIDANFNAWQLATTSNTNIINWHTDATSPFIEHFGIMGIPRYILIAPDGKPLEHDLPSPKENAFEKILKQYID